MINNLQDFTINANNFIKFIVDKPLTDTYKIVKPQLGEGAYGCVYKCIHKSSGVEHAVKVMNKSNLSIDSE